MKLEKFENKRILILGWGKEGKDALNFFQKMPFKKTLGVADQKEFSFPTERFPRIKLYWGKNYLKAADNYDLIVKSPGIPYKNLPKKILKKIITPTEIFFSNYPGKIIGITGTKGKSTTASMVYQILKEGNGNRRVFLGGNIGKPALSFLSKARNSDIFVYELSCHQLYKLKKSPSMAILLNLYPEHLDYYKNFKDYISAKANIFLHQNKEDFLIYNSTDKLIKKIIVKSPAKKIPIRGEYYDLDKEAVRQVGKLFNISDKKIERTLKKFKNLPHRLELVGTFGGIIFYNDALATIPEATASAIDKLGGKVETIILGGFDRKISFKKLADKILQSKIKTVILFPTTGKKIRDTIMRQNNLRKRKKKLNYFFVYQSGASRCMKEAVEIAYRYTSKGNICLLSTACPSFSIFKDYREKGNLFKKYVQRDKLNHHGKNKK